MGIVVVRLPSGQLKAIATDAAGNKTTFGVNIGASSASGKRTSWRELIH
jgi:type IV pilus assembly protein PilY1